MVHAWPRGVYALYAGLGILLNEALFQLARPEAAFATWLGFAWPDAPVAPWWLSALSAVALAALVAAGVAALGRARPRAFDRSLGLVLLAGAGATLPAASVAKGAYAATFTLVAVYATYAHVQALPAIPPEEPRRYWVLAAKSFKAALILGAFLATSLATTLVATFQAEPGAAPGNAEAAADLRGAQTIRHVLAIGYYAAGALALAIVPILRAAAEHPRWMVDVE